MERRRAMMMPKGGGFQVYWNSLRSFRSHTDGGVTAEVSADRRGAHISGTANVTKQLNYFGNYTGIPGHKYYQKNYNGLNWNGIGRDNSRITNIRLATGTFLYLKVEEGDTFDDDALVMMIDLTQMFGEGNEPTDIAAFESWLAENNLDGYQPYTEGEIKTTTKPSWI